MLFFLIKFQIAAIIILIMICLDYAKNIRLDVLSTKFYGWLLVVSGINLMFDLGTAYALWYYRYMPVGLVDFLHKLFLISLNVLLFGLYAYVCILCRSSFFKKTRRAILMCLPVVIASVLAVTLPINYYLSNDAVYSYGPSVLATYICAIFYLSAINIQLVASKNLIEKSLRCAIHVATFLWVLAVAIQGVYPSVLLSGFATAIMMLYIYLSFENPKNYMDIETSSFNSAALRTLLTEDILINKDFTIFAVAIDNLDNLNKKLGYAMAAEIMCKLAKSIAENFNSHVFRYRDNTLVLVLSSSIGDFNNLSAMLLAKVEHNDYLQEYGATLDIHINIINCKKYAKDVDGVYELLDFMNEFEDKEVVRILDDDYLSKKMRYERIEKLVADAIVNDGFEIYYQPIYSTKNNKYESAEALLRLKSSQGLGYVSPEEFIPIAERKGYIMDIGDITFDKIFDFYTREKLHNEGIEYLEINLSAIQASDLDIADRVEAIRKKYAMPPRAINLEVTETAATESGKILNESVGKLKELGYTFSMDDFGTGYANLMQVIEIEYDFIKIDKSIVWAYFEAGERKRKSEAIFKSVVGMAKSLGLKIVAEGVETKEQADTLREFGIDYLQGYCLSRPLPKDEFIAFLRKYRDEKKNVV